MTSILLHDDGKILNLNREGYRETYAYAWLLARIIPQTNEFRSRVGKVSVARWSNKTHRKHRCPICGARATKRFRIEALREKRIHPALRRESAYRFAAACQLKTNTRGLSAVDGSSIERGKREKQDRAYGRRASCLLLLCIDLVPRATIVRAQSRHVRRSNENQQLHRECGRP